MERARRGFIHLVIIVASGLVPAMLVQFLTGEPVHRHYHIRNFRYGKDPYVIRCNRGDTLHFTFSSDDTGHSFFLEEFDVDVKVSPANDEVLVFGVEDPSARPYVTNELKLVAEFQGLARYLVSKVHYRCHVWCGPMHAFEQGKLVIMPNTLLSFSLGSLLAVIGLWIASIFRAQIGHPYYGSEDPRGTDLFQRFPLLRKAVVSRWPQVLFMILALCLIYVVIMTSILGTKMSGRNLGVVLMWIVWLFLLIVVLTPLGGRVWCTVCPLPIFGDWIQRGSLFSPRTGKTGAYNNRFSGLFLKWPAKLDNNWLRVVIFLVLATFSTTLVASPKVSGFVLLGLLLAPTAMSMVFELRAFCRYVCPVHAFVGPFSGMSVVALRNRSQEVCDRCKPHYCQNGNARGWACPYGLNVGKMKESMECGLCLECVRSCTYRNISLFARPFASERRVHHRSDAWLVIAIFTIATIYSILYLGPWPIVRDFVNILDKKNWDLFGLYAIFLWLSTLVVVPALVYLVTLAGTRWSGIKMKTTEAFLSNSGTLLPMGLCMWMSFVVPMLFVNFTFLLQSLSDPFGWGWDFFGTANTPWHQVLPGAVPWIQAILMVTGAGLSLRNLKRNWTDSGISGGTLLRASLPMGLFQVLVTVLMLFFFTN
jgi:polyferredoxin